MSQLGRFVYRLCLLLYPRSFRLRHEGAHLSVFDDQLRAASKRGTRAAITCILVECVDVARCGVRQRVRAWRSQDGSRPPVEAQGSRQWENLVRDTRGVVRTFVHRPLAPIGVILLLGVAIGANTALFSIVNAYLLRPLPFHDGDRLADVNMAGPTTSMTVFRQVLQSAGSIDWPSTGDGLIEEFVTWDIDDFTVLGEGVPDVLRGAWISPSFLRALGVQPLLGRGLAEMDGEPGAPLVALLSHATWQQRYGGRADILGRTISAFSSDRPEEADVLTIVGVLPPDFWFVNGGADIFANLRQSRAPYVIRLRDGVTVEQAEAHLTSLLRSQSVSLPDEWTGVSVTSLHDRHVQEIRPILAALAFAVGLVLVIACGNVALLLTVQSLARRGEMAVRMALGASQWTIVRQLAIEGIVLTLGAGVLGVTIAGLLLVGLGPLVQRVLGVTIPGGADVIGLDGRVLLVTVSVCALIAVGFAIVPLVAGRLSSVTASLRATDRSVRDTPWRRRFRDIIIGVEVALSVLLVVGAGLMVRSALHLQRLDLGFDPSDVVTANINLRLDDYRQDTQRTQFVDELLARVDRIDGVQGATASVGWPFQTRLSGGVATPEAGDVGSPDAAVYIVAPGYYETMSIPVLRGRPFDVRDGTNAEPVVIVSEHLAGQLWPNAESIDRRIRLAVEGDDALWRRVVGVVSDVRETLTDEPLPDTYIPYHQSPGLFLFVNVRVSGDPTAVVAEVRRTIADLDPAAALTRIRPLEELVRGERARPQFLAGALTLFGIFATTLALVGLYAIVAFSVRQRRGDVAVHMALGANKHSIIGLFVRQTSLVIVLGLVGGVVGSLAATQVLESQLFGVNRLDAVAYLATVVVLGLAALSAVWLPAHRAATANPANVLRD